MKIIAPVFAAIVALGLTMPALADLDTLIEVGRGQAEIQKHYKEEGRAYKAVKRAFDSGALVKGMPKADIQKRFGEPVVDFYDSGRGMEKWLYKPAAASFFGGEQIAIFFNDKGFIEEIDFREKAP